MKSFQIAIRAGSAALALLLAVPAFGATAPPPAPHPGAAMPAPIVFFDIAGPDQARQSAFYRSVFGWDIAPDGRFTATVAAPLTATLRQDPADKVIYIGVEDVAATLSQVTAHGGAVVAPRFAVPGVVILGLFTDPAGNRMGLVEMKDGKPVVP